ncbi:hypothetical protein ACE1ET_16830 [Saccharicrinis sp. FJH62]|uniref:hypothetical protein n=1 Tax=Saccharicrinis sp. FJH62 TaxID=3344657 RepID=UPI0035D4D532
MKLKKKIFISPTPNANSGMYISNLANSLSKYFNIANKGKQRKPAYRELIRYFFVTDIFVLNWIENEPVMKNGMIRLIIIVLFLSLAKVFGKKIIWTFHNLEPHNVGHNYGSKRLTDFLKKKSDLIVHHTTKSLYLTSKSKNFYSFHPFESPSESFFYQKMKDYKYDILIWGRIEPYKGVVEFLKYVRQDKDLANLRILLAGKVEDPNYREEVCENLSENISFKEGYITEEELIEEHVNSKFVFFPHQGPSILNSGQLVVSLGYGATIIGPKKGAFEELSEQGLILGYDDYSDIIGLMGTSNSMINKSRQFSFILENSWDNYAGKLSERISCL